MRTYKVEGITCEDCELAITKALKACLGEDTPVEVNSRAGEVKLDESADPQIAIFAIEGAGYKVVAAD